MPDNRYGDLIGFIRELYRIPEGVIPLHAPILGDNEKKYLNHCIDTTFVSTVGEYVNQLEETLCKLTGADYAIATVNGTSALHAALVVTGVKIGDEVLTQPFTFVATANAISYCNASPVFLDIDEETLGLSPAALEHFLRAETISKNGQCHNKVTGRRIGACVPMHTFGNPCNISRIVEICSQYNIPVIEDAAEALGSKFHNRHCGTYGFAGIFSFNGNKIVTSGGGGAIVTSDPVFSQRVRYITTTAKKAHPYFYEHTEIGFNYRLPNINAALACAQLDQLDRFLTDKRETAAEYKRFCSDKEYRYFEEPAGCRSNYWLHALVMPDKLQRDKLLEETNEAGIMTRPAWNLLNDLEMYRHCQADSLQNALYYVQRIVNVPSSVRQ